MAHLEEAFQVSQRRACGVLGADRTMVRYVSRRPDDAKARARIRELASERRRFGYRRLHWLMCREGWAMNHKKFRRLYREEKLRAVGASVLWAPERPYRFRKGLISVGRWTLSRMLSPAAGASVSLRLSMTTAASA